MRRVLLIMAFLVYPCVALSASADSTSAAPAPRNSLRSGAWALQFDINGTLLSVESFAGGLSLKRHFSPKSALRFGLGLDASSRDLNTETNFVRTVNQNLAGTFLEAVYQRYTNPTAPVNVYWGIGPRLSYSDETAESVSGSVYNRDERKNWTAEAIGAFGAEWFAARQFSIHGEFTARGGYVSEKTTSERKVTGQAATTSSTENKGWVGGISNTVRLGLSVYF